MSEHKQSKIDIEYRYSMPLQWILDMLAKEKQKEIKKFDILNAQHELDILIHNCNNIKESDY